MFAGNETVTPPNDGEVSELDSSWGILILMLLLTFTFLASFALQRWKVRVVHESLIAILLGAVVGLIIHSSSNESVKKIVVFDHRYFFNLLLPPIILHSGYDLQVAHFFHHLGSILVFAFAGTLISSLVIGSLVYLVVMAGMHSLRLTFMECLMFGSILSSTDPVTILAIFNQLRVDINLYAIIFGESMLNDAVAIVLYSTFDRFREHELTAEILFRGIGSFFGVFFGSCLVGVLFAFMAALMFKHSDIYRYPSIESCLAILMAYMTYLLSNAVQLSGIVSLLFCGIAMKHYMFENLSLQSKRTTTLMFRVLANMSENFIFIYLGLTIFTKEDEVFHWGLIIFTMLFILVARALSVFPLARLINNLERAKRVGVWQYIKARLRPRNDFSIHILESANSEPDTISKPHQVMLWWAGLRGAIAFALSLDMKTPSAMEVRTTTLVVVISSIVLLGGSTVFALKRLRIQMNEKAISSPVRNLYDTEEQSQQPNQDYSRTAAHWFLKIDSAYLRPFLIRNNINTGSQYLFLEDQMGEFEHELDVTRQETVLLQQ